MTQATAPKTTIPPSPKWDLESIFPGGSDSKEFEQFRKEQDQGLGDAAKMFESLGKTITADNVDSWVSFIDKLQSLYANLELVVSFSGCLTAQNVDDKKALAFESEADSSLSEWMKLQTRLEAVSVKQSDDQWNILTSHPKMIEIKFYLDELRKIGSSKMPVELESLALDLAVSGYHGWGRLYDKMGGDLKVDFTENGVTKELSLGQLATKMADSNRETRKAAFEKMESAWENTEELAAMTLNSLGGFRLNLYKNRKWNSVLDEPLTICRMQKQTLNTMWKVISENVSRLQPYVDAKKKLLKIDKYCWYDEFSAVGSADKLYSYKEACDFIYDNVNAFSTHMGDFVKMAVDKNWIEAEDRPGKRGGGFCTGTGPKKETRIFMTYSGTYGDLLTLAHELGHSYHSWVLKDKAYLAGDYPMNLAETASTFVETLVTDAALGQTTNPKEKLMLLEQKIQAAYTMMCNIHTRYIFENSFYAEREKGVVGSARLRELMVTAQKKAFGPLLDESGYHPLFWCSKLHFYITEVPFYNFPYTFGFMFSGGIYDRAKKEGAAFADKYQALLADTGSMSTEEVARKHLGVNLAEESFWKDAVDRSLADIDEFVRLADSM